LKAERTRKNLPRMRGGQYAAPGILGQDGDKEQKVDNRWIAKGNQTVDQKKKLINCPRTNVPKGKRITPMVYIMGGETAPKLDFVTAKRGAFPSNDWNGGSLI